MGRAGEAVDVSEASVRRCVYSSARQPERTDDGLDGIGSPRCASHLISLLILLHLELLCLSTGTSILLVTEAAFSPDTMADAHKR